MDARDLSYPSYMKSELVTSQKLLDSKASFKTSKQTNTKHLKFSLNLSVFHVCLFSFPGIFSVSIVVFSRRNCYYLKLQG